MPSVLSRLANMEFQEVVDDEGVVAFGPLFRRNFREGEIPFCILGTERLGNRAYHLVRLQKEHDIVAVLIGDPYANVNETNSVIVPHSLMQRERPDLLIKYYAENSDMFVEAKDDAGRGKQAVLNLQLAKAQREKQAEVLARVEGELMSDFDKMMNGMDELDVVEEDKEEDLMDTDEVVEELKGKMKAEEMQVDPEQAKLLQGPSLAEKYLAHREKTLKEEIISINKSNTASANLATKKKKKEKGKKKVEKTEDLKLDSFGLPLEYLKDDHELGFYTQDSEDSSSEEEMKKAMKLLNKKKAAAKKKKVANDSFFKGEKLTKPTPTLNDGYCGHLSDSSSDSDDSDLFSSVGVVLMKKMVKENGKLLGS